MDCDIAIVGAGAAGLMAAIFAGREGKGRVIALDGASRIGAKILISGGGRCNVTHDEVSAADFNGNRHAVAKVLRSFSVEDTIKFFASLGVELKREEGGKLFPITDHARTVLDALLAEAERCGAAVRPGMRVESIVANGDAFVLSTARDTVVARRVVLATGGRSVPKTGSDGLGYRLVRSFGHSTSETFPALVPLVLEPGHWITKLSGISLDAELILRTATGRTLRRERGSMLFTHFGLSGPLVLDMSRHWIAARREQAGVVLAASLLPCETIEGLDAALVAEARRNPRATIASFLRRSLTERLIAALAANAAGLGAETALAKLTKEGRRRLVRALLELVLPVERDRGFDYAEVTAGGVPLSEIDLATMRSRMRPELYLCGEIFDADGRIGGFNFQWAWASGRLAGMHAARSLP
ncbi:MAG TPA: aminoacetone oxidase family FAD-binding enzyme [Thermoanaerobaculia bacterium]|nr:aminoacetone oxidase family FAD-binding enzyme [Thermoanaerobaculia bacterium]